MAVRTVGFMKLTEEMTMRCYMPRPQDDHTVTIPVGIYEVQQYDDRNELDYYARFVTDQGETKSCKYSEREISAMAADEKFFRVK